MDTRYLSAFLSTAKYLSFSKAAEELNIAQSAVSRQIKLLEESIGEELIIRSSKKVLLTQNGKKFLIATQNYVQTANEIFKFDDQFKVLRIGTLQGILNSWLSKILIQYSKKYNRKFEIIIDVQHNLKNLIEEGRCDLVFSTDNFQTDLLSSLKLFNEKLVLISKKPINKNDIHKYPWIVYQNRDSNLLLLSNKPKKSKYIIPSLTTIKELVKSSIGIAVVPHHIIKKSDKLTIREFKELPNNEIFMTTLNFKKYPRYIKEFTDCVLKVN